MPISADRILYEDDYLLAVNKLSSELVVKGSGKVGKLPLLDLLKKDYPGLQTLHRLDFETSGVVVFAKSKEVASKAKEGFKDWKKYYSALVMGQVGRKSGKITKPLPARTGKGTIDAITRYRTVQEFTNSSLVDIQLDTGRHHQIRRHFAHIKHPLALDNVYGHKKYNQTFSRELGYRKFFLHAAKVVLPHPVTGEQLTIEAPLPKNFLAVLELLRSL